MKNLSGFSTSDRFMCRFDFSTQSLEILAGPFKACGTTWSFDVRTNTIYHTIYHVNEEGKTEIHLYSLDTGSKEWTYLATMPTQAVPAHIQGSRLYFNTLGNVIYELDLNDPEKEVVMLDQTGTIHGEYAYYFDVDTAEDAVVANIPDALSGYELQIGAAKSYTDYSADLYRINLVMPNAEPELIMENASTKYNLRYSNGYICAAESEPYLAATALYDGNKYYTMDDPNAKDDMKLVTLFLPTKTFHIFDVDTLEERVLAFDDVYLNDISIDRSNDRLVFTYSNVSEKAVVKVNNKSGDDTSQSYAVLPFDFETFTGATDADVFVIGNKRP